MDIRPLGFYWLAFISVVSLFYSLVSSTDLLHWGVAAAVCWLIYMVAVFARSGKTKGKPEGR